MNKIDKKKRRERKLQKQKAQRRVLRQERWKARLAAMAQAFKPSNFFRSGRKAKGKRYRLFGRAKRPGLTGPLVRMCPGGRHAWIDTKVGVIRKPIAAIKS